MYKEFAKTAREEGFEDIAKFFERVAEVEAEHESRGTASSLKPERRFSV